MPSRLKLPNELAICTCGCGGEFWRYDDRGRARSFINGHTNGGKTVTAEQRAKIASSLRGRPSGMLGKRQSEEARRLISRAFAGKPLSPEFRARLSAVAREKVAKGERQMPDNAGQGRYGKRADLGGVYFRSAWEANVARVLTHLGVRWEYEKTRFSLSDGRSYRPDFYLPLSNRYLEVKGFWWGPTRDRFEQFRREYPDVRISLIDLRKYSALRLRFKSLLPEWEESRRRT